MEYHVTIRLQTLMEMSDGELTETLVAEGKPLTPEQVRQDCRQLMAQGYEFLPTCDRHDSRGWCLGHP